MKYTYIILIICSLVIVTSIIIFHIKFTAKYSFDYFMHTLKNKIYEKEQQNEERNETDNFSYDYLDKIEEVFGRYSDTSGLTVAFYSLMSLFILIITIIEIIFLLIFLRPKCLCCCKNCFSLFSPIHSLLNMIIYLILAFREKYKVNLEEEEIYIFDEEFNKEIRKNIDFMKKRKIYLIVCALLAFIGVLAQLVMVILNYIKERNSRNNNYINNFNGQPQMVYSSENSQQKNDVNINYNNYNYNVPVK